ncbi:hypothetical protein GL50803_0017242 [Giardia duodenalis]|uniref:Uncharacterized protein n=1 Tax=Giardia intestinalis (strain ATCC 50803 / WB clone C6) TaxID=184922 RepID=D3KHJ4_GIAIC|nr:hypothetical protein GL50803_0017242 [Giardia intestinalis]KAE8302780.1 hypothetical protein GL50803_0017242 [Giardia intestinalis]
MSINPAYLGAGLRHAYAFGPLTPEEGLFTVSCFGDVAFCSENVCIALANSTTLDLTIPIPSPTDTLEDDPLNSISGSRCLWRISDSSPSVPQQLIWGLAETKMYRALCPRLCVVTFLGDIYLYTFFLGKTITSYLPAHYVRRMVPNLYTSHVIALTDQLAYIAISTIGETKDSVTITILQVTIAPEAYADGVIDESSLEIKRLHVFSSVSHIISVSYEPLIGAAAILCDLCCIFINFRINDSIIVQQSVVLGTDVTRMQKITMIPISCNHDMRVYAFCVDSTLRIFTVAFVHHLNGPFDIVSVRLHGAWSPIDGLKSATTTNDKLRSVVPSPIIHSLEGLAENGGLVTWGTASYQLSDPHLSIAIPSEPEGCLHYISDMVAILPSLVGILTMNGAVIFLDFNQDGGSSSIHTTSTQLLLAHFSDATLSLIAGPCSADPSSVTQLLPIRRVHIIPLRMIVSSFVPLSVSAFCLHKPISGTTQQRLLRTTAHRLPFPYGTQCLVQRCSTSRCLFLQQEITKDATPQLLLPKDLTIQSLRAAGTLTPQHCRDAFLLALQSSKYKRNINPSALLETASIENVTDSAFSGVAYSLCVFTGELCSDLSLPFCSRCEVVFSDTIVSLVQQVRGSPDWQMDRDSIITLFIELGTVYWLCPMCLSPMSYL